MLKAIQGELIYGALPFLYAHIRIYLYKYQNISFFGGKQHGNYFKTPNKPKRY